MSRSSSVGFGADAEACLLLIATDGLWKYAGRIHVADATAVRPLDGAAAALVDGVRLDSGALQDDVALAI